MATAVENISTAEVQAASKVVLESATFGTTPALRRLLAFLSENHGHALSEYAIAIDGLGRRHDFDPNTDSTVRGQIKRLRDRLQAFYVEEGKYLPTQLYIPMGTHELALRPSGVVAAAPEPLTVPVITPVSVLAPENRNVSLGNAPRKALSVVLFICVTALATFALYRWFPLSADAGHSVLTGVWRDVFRNNRSARIIIPSPVFFSWKSKSGNRLMVRDTDVNNYTDLEKSGEMSGLKTTHGDPELVQAYTAAPDTFAALKLIQFLDRSSVQLAASSDGDPISASQTGENVILLGTSRTLAPYAMYFRDLGFVMDSASGTIVNQNPLAGESKIYSVLQESPERKRAPVLFAVVPIPGSTSRMVVLLSSYDTLAVVSFLTSPSGLEQLEQARQRSGAGDFFVAVIETETKSGNPIGGTVAALHPIRERR